MSMCNVCNGVITQWMTDQCIYRDGVASLTTKMGRVDTSNCEMKLPADLQFRRAERTSRELGIINITDTQN